MINNIQTIIKLACAQSDYNDVLNNLKNVTCPNKLFDHCDQQMYWYLTCESQIQHNNSSHNTMLWFIIFMFVILFLANKEKKERTLL